jgi:hypothetical protein
MTPTVDVVVQSPQSAVELLHLALSELSEGSTFLDTAISFIPDNAFPDLVKLALERFEQDRNNTLAEDIIGACTLQSVRSLHPYLNTIFELMPNKEAYYSLWPWRESGKQHFTYLRNKLNTECGSEIGRRAWRAMLETRDPEILQFAADQAYRIGMSGECESHLNLVGYESSHKGLRKLCSDFAYHIFFPSSYLPTSKDPDTKWFYKIRSYHPTWILPDNNVAKMPFGGCIKNLCACCGGALHRFMVIDPIPDNLGITGLSRLELATCLSCLGCSHPVFFYAHDKAGAPQQIGYSGAYVEPEFPAVAFKETEVQITQLSDRWRWQNDAMSNSRENLNRVAGEPCWIQDSEYPSCPECNRRMKFILQLDSDLPTVDDGEWMWGDSGICYTFWCDECKVSGFLWQCY